MSLDCDFQSPYDLFLPGQASDYIESFAIEPDMPVILAVRVSGREQARNGNDEGQTAWLQKIVVDNGGIVADIVSHVGSGCDPCWLAMATTLAQEHNAIILAESTDRLIRDHRYHSKLRPDLQARNPELRYMRSFTRGVRVMTYLPPEATPYEVRRHQRERGKWFSGNKGGRGKKKRTRPRFYLPRFNGEAAATLRTHLANGLSVEDIACQLRRPLRTVYGWIRRLDEQ